MNKKLVAVIVLMALVMLAIGPLTAVASSPDLFKPDTTVPFPLVFTLNFNWTGFGGGTTSMTLNDDHTFVTGDGNSGQWQYTGSIKRMRMLFSTGCLPLYEGYYAGHGYLSGTMQCTDGSGSSGTWDMQYVPNPTARPAFSSTGSSASPK